MRITELRNVTLGVEVLREIGDRGLYRLTIEDKEAKEILWMTVPQVVADQLVAKLTGGIQVATRMPPAS